MPQEETAEKGPRILEEGTKKWFELVEEQDTSKKGKNRTRFNESKGESSSRRESA